MDLRSVSKLALCLALALAACGGGKKSSAKEIKVAAAADLSRAFEELGKVFEDETGIHPTFTFGSTGLLAKQIQEGAPFDAFAAANVEYVDQVVAKGACDKSTQALYARGRLVMWSKRQAPASLQELADPKYAKIAIANPEHAPYGRAAQQALEKAGVWAQVEPRIVRGENVLQTLQYAESGNADVALVALSLTTVTSGGTSTPIDPAMHAPIDQALVVCGKGPGGEAAKKFTAFVGSPRGREIMTRYGFLLPGETRAAADPPARPAAAARLDATKVGALIDAWLDAQNKGDFAAYQALYADRFGGIKRVGSRIWRFDRKGWLADRGRMFKRPMTVDAEDREVDVTGAMAVARFHQTYEQGKFKDAGEKQLVVVDTPAGPRIAREEMLRSTVLDGPGSPKASGFAVLDGWLVLAGEGTYATTGEPTMKEGGLADYAVTQPVTGLGEAWTKRIGQTVTLYPSGAQCKIGAYQQLDLLSPHFMTRMEWRGDEDGDGTPEHAPLEGKALAAQIQGSGATYLVAALDGCTPGESDVIAVAGSGAPWKVASDDALAASVEKAFHADAAYRALDDEYKKEYGGSGAWTDAEDGSEDVTLWRSPDGKATYAIVHARAGNGCGDFFGDLAIAYRLDGGKPVSLGQLEVGDRGPSVVVDTNRDGVPEIAGVASQWAWTGKTYQPAYDLDLGFRDCGC